MKIKRIFYRALNSKFLTIAIALYIVFISTILNWVINQQKNVDPWKNLDITSSLAYAQLIFWAVVVFTSVILISLSKKLKLAKLIQIFLINLIALSSGLITASISTSLKTHIQFFGDLQGDLGVHIQMATNAFNSGWEYSGYPPLFPTIVGNIAHLVEFNTDPTLQIVSAHKFVSIHSIPIWAGITYLLFRYAFPAILAEVLALITVLSIGTDGWKNVGEIGTQLMILILIKRLYEAFETGVKATFAFRVKTLTQGVFFGLFVTLYFGRLWWISLALALIIFLSNFIIKNKHVIQLSVHDFLLGALLPLTPMLMASKYSEVKINSSISSVLLILIFVIGVWITTKSDTIEKLRILKLSTILVSFLIIFAIFNFEIDDTNIYPGVFGNMVNFLDIADPLNLVIFSLLLAFTSFGIVNNQLIMLQISFVVLVILSSLVMMLYFAFEMMYTNKVELWPRAGFTILSNIQMLFVLLTYSLVIGLKEKIEFLTSHRQTNLQTQTQIYALVVVLLLVSLYVSTSLGTTQWTILSQ